jgi:hypothetical protein
MAKFRTEAKLTHNKYGIMSQKAVFEILRKPIMVISIAIQRKTMTMKAARGACSPKNMGDQIALRKSWMKKKTNDFRFTRYCLFLSQTRNRAMPINMYSRVHAGPKIHGGGLKIGLLSPLYHDGIAGAVMNPPVIPADKQIKIDPVILAIFFFMLMKSYHAATYFPI